MMDFKRLKQKHLLFKRALKIILIYLLNNKTGHPHK